MVSVTNLTDQRVDKRGTSTMKFVDKKKNLFVEYIKVVRVQHLPGMQEGCTTPGRQVLAGRRQGQAGHRWGDWGCR